MLDSDISVLLIDLQVPDEAVDSIQYELRLFAIW